MDILKCMLQPIGEPQPFRCSHLTGLIEFCQVWHLLFGWKLESCAWRRYTAAPAFLVSFCIYSTCTCTSHRRQTIFIFGMVPETLVGQISPKNIIEPGDACCGIVTAVVCCSLVPTLPPSVGSGRIMDGVSWLRLQRDYRPSALVLPCFLF